MSAASPYDTIIIGGGPGGSTAGALLARAGQRVLILEKEKFPRFHIGESLLPFGNAVLQESGAWEKVQAAGFIQKLGAEFVTGNGEYCQRFWFRDGLFPQFAGTYQVERSKFDELLLNHAADSGCEVRQGTPVQSVQITDDGASVTFAGGTAQARWLIDASGRDTFVGRTLNLPREQIDMPKRIAVYAHFEGVFRYDGEMEGHIGLVRLNDGWFWMIPFAGAKTSVGMVRTIDNFKKLGGEANECFTRTVAECPELQRRMKDARRVSEWYVTSDYTYGFRQLAFPRAFLVGDAGTFIDPIFSSGVFIALKSASLAARQILKSNGRALTVGEQARYTKEIHRMRDVYLRMIRAFYDNESFSVFMQPTKRLQLVQTVNAILAGYTERRFGMWWRVQLFYFICWLQHHFPLAKRLDFDAPAKELAHT